MFKKLITKVQKGFTPVELLILVGISAVFAGVVIFSSTAPKQMAQVPSTVYVDRTPQAKADTPAVMCTTVPPAKSNAPVFLIHPSMPQTQCATGS